MGLDELPDESPTPSAPTAQRETSRGSGVLAVLVSFLLIGGFVAVIVNATRTATHAGVRSLPIITVLGTQTVIALPPTAQPTAAPPPTPTPTRTPPPPAPAGTPTVARMLPMDITFACATVVTQTSGKICIHTLPLSDVFVNGLSYCMWAGESGSLFPRVRTDANGDYTWTWVPTQDISVCRGQEGDAHVTGFGYSNGQEYTGEATTTFVVP